MSDKPAFTGRLTLFRQPASTQPVACTLGQMAVDGVRRWWTLERPWVPDPVYVGGTPGRSCVPAGVYTLERHNSEAHPRSFALVNPALGVVHYDAPALRSLVLIHVANRVEELRGCIALGMFRAEGPPGQWQLVRSALAIAAFNAAIPWIDGHQLQIIQE